MSKWPGIMKVLEIEHVREGSVIQKYENLPNMLHAGGELFILSCCFDNGGTLPPAQYFLGLDNRTTISSEDAMTDLVGEPVGGGYIRAAVNSSGHFAVDIVGGIYRATSQVVTFSAISPGWGPARNLFLSTSGDNTGLLISSVILPGSITLVAGDSVNLRMALALKDAG